MKNQPLCQFNIEIKTSTATNQITYHLPRCQATLIYGVCIVPTIPRLTSAISRPIQAYSSLFNIKVKHNQNTNSTGSIMNNDNWRGTMTNSRFIVFHERYMSTVEADIEKAHGGC